MQVHSFLFVKIFIFWRLIFRGVVEFWTNLRPSSRFLVTFAPIVRGSAIFGPIFSPIVRPPTWPINHAGIPSAPRSCGSFGLGSQACAQHTVTKCVFIWRSYPSWSYPPDACKRQVPSALWLNVLFFSIVGVTVSNSLSLKENYFVTEYRTVPFFRASKSGLWLRQFRP